MCILASFVLGTLRKCILASFVLGTLCKCTLCKYFKTYALGTLHIFLDCFLGFWTKYVWGTQSVQPGNYVREGGDQWENFIQCGANLLPPFGTFLSIYVE